MLACAKVEDDEINFKGILSEKHSFSAILLVRNYVRMSGDEERFICEKTESIIMCDIRNKSRRRHVIHVHKRA